MIGFSDMFTALDTFAHHNGDGGVHFPFVDGAHVGVLIESLVEAFAESPVQFLVENLKESEDFVELLVEPWWRLLRSPKWNPFWSPGTLWSS